MTRYQKPRTDTKCSPEELQRRRDYYQRPEVKARYKERHDSEANKAYMREYRKRPEAKLKLRQHNLSLRGFTVELRDQLIEFQEKRCALCGHLLKLDKPRTVHSDHCHDSKRPRGILCIHCNHAEGAIRRVGLSPEEFGRRLTAYLENPPADQLAAKAPGS